MSNVIISFLLHFTNYILVELIRLLLTGVILVIFVLLLYLLLTYSVLIKIKFFRELLKEFGLPIPIEYRELDKDK